MFLFHLPQAPPKLSLTWAMTSLQDTSWTEASCCTASLVQMRRETHQVHDPDRQSAPLLLRQASLQACAGARLLRYFSQPGCGCAQTAYSSAATFSLIAGPKPSGRAAAAAAAPARQAWHSGQPGRRAAAAPAPQHHSAAQSCPCAPACQHSSVVHSDYICHSRSASRAFSAILLGRTQVRLTASVRLQEHQGEQLHSGCDARGGICVPAPIAQCRRRCRTRAPCGHRSAAGASPGSWSASTAAAQTPSQYTHAL